jgi:AcrR family transcriptional regulator
VKKNVSQASGRKANHPHQEQPPSKREVKRAILIQSLIHSIAENGWEQTTLEKVGAQHGMTRAHVAYYFQGREEMLLAAIRLVASTAQALTVARVEKALGWKNQLEAVVQGAIDWLKQYPEQAKVFLLFYYLGSLSEDYRSLQTQIRNAGLDRIVSILSNASTRNLSAKKIQKLAKKIQNQITGTLVDFTVTHSDLSLAEVQKTLFETILALVQAETQDAP